MERRIKAQRSKGVDLPPAENRLATLRALFRRHAKTGDFVINIDVSQSVVEVGALRSWQAAEVIQGTAPFGQVYPSNRNPTNRRKRGCKSPTSRSRTFVGDLPTQTLHVLLQYPLSTYRELVVEPFDQPTISKDGWTTRKRMTLGYLLWCVAREYRRIYSTEKNLERYGVWGHGISDLHFEGVRIRNGQATILIGS